MISANPFVGREAELRVLRAAVVGATPSAGVVITGEAGSGKTRLVTAMIDAAVGEGATAVVGYCLPRSRAIPFLPVVDVLRALADVVGVDGEPLLAGALERCPPYVRSELARLLPELLTAGEAVFTAADSMERQRLFDAIRRVLLASAQTQVIVVILEDVHWADASTLELCDYLFAPTHHTGTPIVMTCRAADVGDEWLAATVARARLPRVDLAPLTRTETAAQIAALLNRDVDDATVDLVYQRTGGHAYYTEQLAAAPTELPGSLIPAGLRSVLLTRISPVTADARRILAVLALAARPLDEATVAAGTEWPVARVRQAVRVLTGDGFITSAGDAYQLRHALLGDAVASDLLPGERHELHLGIAHALAGQSHPAPAAEIADHFAAAGADADELRWRVDAAAQADDRLAATDAASHRLRAIDLRARVAQTSAPPLSALYLRASYSCDHAGRIDDAAVLAEQALTSLSAEAAPAHRAQVLRLAGHWRSIASPAAGIALLRQAAELHESLPASADQVLTLHRIYQLLLRERGTTDSEQRDLLARALRAATDCGATGLQRLLTGALASVSLIAGDRAGAMRQAEQAAAISPDSTAHSTIGAAIYVTEVLLKCGEYRRAAEIGPAELRWADDNGYPQASVTARLRTGVIDALREQGRVSDAAALLPNLGSPDMAPVDIEAAHLRCLSGVDPASVDVAELFAEERRRSAALFDREYISLGTEIHLWAGAPQRAVEDALPFLDYVSTNDVSALAGGLFALAARACADLADRGRQLDDHDLARSAKRLEARVSDALERCPRNPFTGDVPATAQGNGLVYAAERSRLLAYSDPDMWAGAAAAWRKSGQPHRASYTLYRQAEALLASPASRAAAGPILREAAALADQHTPLTRAIRELAHRARVTIDTPLAAETGSPISNSLPFNLTARELSVLGHLGAGYTNAQIGQTLFISASTVGVHVSNILRKLNVTSRVQAAAVAATLGLLHPLTSTSDRSSGDAE